ncbi:hypothetical protein OG474_05365 [Kribbella sp. NBC_01505]|uniref:hypothetical protein n=1 Tax=Kribbella sp. NBC_01505 TaxID=2903580 RepID=UPI0038657216
MPTYSDDGKWWWDGRAWQPVTQQPPAPPQQQPYPGPQAQQQPGQPMPQPGQPPYGGPQQQPYPPQQQYPGGQPSYPSGPQGFYQQQPPPKKSRTLLLLVAGAVALLLVLGIGGVVIWKNTGSDDGGTAKGAPPKDAKIIEPGQPVTAQALSEVNPQAFHESVMKRQMTTPIGRLKTSVFGDPQKFATGEPLWSITDMAVDRQTKKYYYAQTILDGRADQKPTNSVCTGDPKPMVWSNYSKDWQRSTFDDLACQKMPYQGGGDGIVSTGLSAEQADKVIAYLRDSKGFVNPAQPTLLTAGGKTFVRQVVDFKPITRADDNYYGSAILMWALREAGADPVEWKWSNPFNLTEGIHMVYYLDPATLLPVAAFESGIDTPAQNGEPAMKRDTIQVVNYSYPTTLPVPKFGNSPNTLTITLPEGWKAQ